MQANKWTQYPFIAPLGHQQGRSTSPDMLPCTRLTGCAVGDLDLAVDVSVEVAEDEVVHTDGRLVPPR